MTKKLTQEEAEKRTKDIGGILVGQYLGTNIKINFKCPQCNIIFKRSPKIMWLHKSILCQNCSANKQSKECRFKQKRAEQKTKDVGGILIGEYKGDRVITEFQCPQCDVIFKRIPHNVWNEKSILCKKCAINYRDEKRRMPLKEVQKRFQERGWELVDKYVNYFIKVKAKCPYCKTIVLVTPKCVFCNETQSCGCMSRQLVAQKHSMASKEDSLGYLYPEIAKLYSKNNTISVLEIYPNSHTKRKFICEKYEYDHEYEMSPNAKINQNQQCPYCNNKKVKVNYNDLASQYPELLLDWDYIRNKVLPTEITYGSKYKAYWKCHKCHQKWQAITDTRTRGSKCPNCCPKSKGEEKIKELLNNWNIAFIYNKRFKSCKNKKSLPFDFYLPSHNLLIEFNGKQHYKVCGGYFGSKRGLKQRQKHDQIKQQWAQDNNIPLFIIPYTQYKDIETILKNAIYK